VKSVAGSAQARNAANPMTGSGMQQARDLRSGGNRRGGAKPRGRNGIPRQAASGPNRAGSNADTGEWTLGRRVGGGESRHPNFAGSGGPQGLHGSLTTRVVGARRSVCRDESHERRSGDPTRATGEHSAGEPRPEGPLLVDVLRDVNQGATPSEDLGGQSGNRQGQGGSGKDQRPATTTSRATNQASHDDWSASGPRVR
jgi:hypothetical protein